MIELVVFGDPAACRGCADTLTRVSTVAGDTVDAVTGALGAVESSWRGTAADAAGVRLAAARSHAATIESGAAAVAAGLVTFADELAVVLARMVDIASDGAGGGLPTSADGVWPPEALPADAEPDRVARHDDQERLYAALATRAGEARDLEVAAHAHLATALGAVTDDPAWISFLKDAGFLPAGWSPAEVGGYGLGAAFMSMDWASQWLTHTRLGRFAPRVNGVFVPIGNGWFGNRWFGPNMVRVLDDANWVARPGQAAAYARWGNIGTWAGRAGTVVSFGLATYDQWQADADDPSLSTSERVGRATTMGVTTAAGGWAGAWGGAQVGAMIGTACGGPVGTVVGGVVGGVIGGVIGSGIGQEVGSWVVDAAGEATEVVVDVVTDAWDAAVPVVSDALESAGDALSGFGDALSFWD